MENGNMTAENVLRVTGIMGVGIGMAWALQILGFAGDSTVFGRLLWVLAAASMAGAGVGLIVAAGALRTVEGNTARA